MGMSSVLNSALSGMRATQAGLELVSRNVAHADVPGYTKKTLNQNAIVSGDSIIGIRIGDASRQLDSLVQRQMWREMSGSGYIGTLARYHSHLDTLFGAPGSPAAIDSLFNGFRSSLEKLTASPDDFTVRDQVLRDGQAMAQMLNQSSADIQSMRLDAERGIAESVQRINKHLEQIAKFNRDISLKSAGGSPPADLLDLRDRHISELSQLIDLKVVERDGGEVALFTQSGALLLDLEPAELTFDARGMITPETRYAKDEAERGVGTVRIKSPNGLVIDLIEDRSIRSGELAALLELRDKTLVQAQEQLDALAASMAKALSATEFTGSPADEPGREGIDLDISQLLSGDRFSIDYSVDGEPRRVTVIRVDDESKLPLQHDEPQAAGETVIGVGFSTSMSDLLQELGGVLGSDFDLSYDAGTLRVLDNGPALATSSGVDYATTTPFAALDVNDVLTVRIGDQTHDFAFDNTDSDDLIAFLQGLGLSVSVDDNDDLVIEDGPQGRGFELEFSGTGDIGLATGLSEGEYGTVSVDAASATATATGFQQGMGLPFFLDGNGGIAYSGSLDGTPQQVGFAGRITVNPDLFADNTHLVKYAADTPIGDSSRPQEILRRLTQQARHYPGTLGVSGSTPFNGTVADFVQRIVSHQGAQAAEVSRAKEAQDVVVAQLEERFTRESGVNIDEEMARLIELQTAFQANSRVIQAYREMVNMLLQL